MTGGRWRRARTGAVLVGVAVGMASTVACGGDGGSDDAALPRQDTATTDVTPLTDEVRPSDPSAAEVLEALRLQDLPGLSDDEIRRVQAERADEPWYQAAPGGAHAEHAHDDAAAEAALDALDAEERATLDDQIARARDAALRYPTFGDAHDAGFRAIGPAAPGLGVHAVQMRHQAHADFHFDYPAVLMYQDTRPDAPVVGMLYLTRSLEPPEGFVGDVDQWHEHIKVCIRSEGDEIEVLSVDDGEYAEQACLDQGGVFFGESGWMLHVWPLDGWTPPEGVFSDDNSLVHPRT
jgi:hypothetical protein